MNAIQTVSATETAASVIGSALGKMSNAEYHAHGAVSNSKLKLFADSRRMYRAIYVDKSQPFKVTEAMQLGSLVHCMVFEPDLLAKIYAVAPKCDRRTTIGKAAWADFVASSSGLEVIDEAMWDQAKAITAALQQHPAAKHFLAMEGLHEQPLFWIDPATGAACRAKLDKVCPEVDVIFDLKVTTDVSPQKFPKTIVEFSYDGQNAWYADGYAATYGTYPNFVFIAVEKTEPYEIGFYEIDETEVRLARERNCRLLEALRNCEMTGDWTSPHEREVMKIRLPRYAAYRDEYRSFE